MQIEIAFIILMAFASPFIWLWMVELAEDDMGKVFVASGLLWIGFVLLAHWWFQWR